MTAVAAGYSLARFNDGEINYAWANQAHRCQRLDAGLKRRLREVWNAEEPDLLIAAPRIVPPHDSLPTSTPG